MHTDLPPRYGDVCAPQGHENKSVIVLSSAEIDRSEWPLHAKRVDVLDLKELELMETATPQTIVNNSHALDWIQDPRRYDKVPVEAARKAPWTALTSDQIRQLIETGIIEEILPGEVLGGVRVFLVAEPSKRRFRVIKCPELINFFLGRDTLMKLDMATKAQIIGLVHKGSFGAEYDFSSFFDQFELRYDISRRQCFKKGRKWYRLCRGAMGQRQMVEVAHTTTKKLADFPGRECATEAVIDNVAFVGGSGADSGPVLRDAERFLERVRRVNGTLNGDTSDPMSLISTKMVFCGVELDFTDKTVRMTQKVLEKLRLSHGNRAGWTRRNLAAHFGLLFWAVGLVVVNPGDYFDALKFYAGVCRAFSLLEDPLDGDFWEEPAGVDGAAEQALIAWTECVLQNVPRKVPPPRNGEPVDWIVCVDSCASGWGYVAVDGLSGETRAHGERWTRDFRALHSHQLHQSVFTEPHGAFNTACHLLSHSGRLQRVHFMTDSVATQTGGNKGFNARSATINDVLVRLRRTFPAEFFEFSFEHLPGTSNTVADYLSRGKAVSSDLMEGAAAAMRAHPLLGGGS